MNDPMSCESCRFFRKKRLMECKVIAKWDDVEKRNVFYAGSSHSSLCNGHFWGTRERAMVFGSAGAAHEKAIEEYLYHDGYRLL